MKLRLDWQNLLSTALGLLVLYGLYLSINWDFVETLDFGILAQYWLPLLTGAAMTLAITAGAFGLGLTAGTVLAILLQLPFGPGRWVILGYIELWRNTPLIVQLFWIHFGLPVLTGISTTALVSGFIALSLQSSAFLADIARAGIQAIPRGQWQAGYALGLPTGSLWLEIILPQALKIMIPALGNLALSFLNGSALLGLIQVGELMTVSVKISDYTFKPIEVMTTAGAIYLVLNLAIGWGVHRLEKMMAVSR